MLTFLRRVRRSLINSNDTKKYIFYAIGEITLVVIGILIALQINNWNEWRKDRTTEKDVLENLARCLEANINRLDAQIDLNARSDEASEIILSSFRNKLPYHDTLNAYFGYASNVDDTGAIFSYYGYEILKNTGMDIIESQILKNEVVFLFEETFAVPKGRMDRVGKTYADEVAFRQKYFLRKQNYDFEPIDYDHMLIDPKVFSWFRSIRQNRIWINVALLETQEETKRILQLIKDELGNME